MVEKKHGLIIWDVSSSVQHGAQHTSSNIFFKVKFESYLLKMLQTMTFDTGKYMEEPIIMGYPIGNLFRN